MIAKELRNPALRTKFQVGDVVRLPDLVWQKFAKPHKMGLPVLKNVSGKVTHVGDRIIEKPKPNSLAVNRLCRFAVVIDTSHVGVIVIWEEWMLEKVSVTSTLESDMRAVKGESNG
jgi:hypothetical protein